MKALLESLKEIAVDIIDYICEADSDTSFKHSAKTFDELLNNNEVLTAHKNPEAVRELVNDIISATPVKLSEQFIYALKGKYFKMKYNYAPAILSLMNNEKYTKIFKFKKESDKKIKVFFVKGGLVFETGSGSIGRVSTEQQETATCVVWNAYVETLKENKIFDTTDINFIKDIVKDLTDNFDEEWILTFGKQVVAITEYLHKIGCDPKDYKMCRYGETVSSNKVSHAYSKFIKNYTKEIGGQKDNFDPSDVLIYLESAENELVSIFEQYAKDPVNSKSKYLSNVFENKLLQGISLKKIIASKAGKYSKYNTGDQNENRIGNVTHFELNEKRTNHKQVVILAEGKFNFDDITDSEGDEVNSVNSVIITLRSFGDSTGIDVCINEKKSPTLGKCPARIWREVIGLNPLKASPLITCTKSMEEFIRNNNEELIKEKLKHIIASAVKEGPACFPFILLH